ncbi:MAG: winged helix-turn-helix domain-containing protein [Pseudomonadota bacterium]|nr:MAG: DNA-binding response regulator [Pseudomonadota bacterium]
MSPRILVVEDEPAIAESVAYALRRDGFATLVAATAAEAERAIADVELVILDLMLPDSSGFDLIASFRKRGLPTPIIVLSSRDDEADRIAALESGADDYVTKPFSPREVVARVRAVLRRVPGQARRTADVPIRVELETRRAYVESRELELTRVEFDLLACLVQSPGRVFTRAQLIDRVWGDGFAITDRTVDSHVKALRRKLSEVGADPAVIETVRGVGFRVAGSAPETSR